MKSELGSNSSISNESELAWEARSSWYSARNSSCAWQISFFSWKEIKRTRVTSTFDDLIKPSNEHKSFLILADQVAEGKGGGGVNVCIRAHQAGLITVSSSLAPNSQTLSYKK